MSAPISPRRVSHAPHPADSLIADWYDGAYLLDSYAIDLPAGRPMSMRVLASRALGNPPGWLRGLLALRDVIVRPFGIKTTDQVRQAQSSENRVDFFPVLDERQDEIVLGEDDRHLDFRVSLQRHRQDDGFRLVATTAVHVHNGLGRAYIELIRPFHILIVKRMLLSLTSPARSD